METKGKGKQNMKQYHNGLRMFLKVTLKIFDASEFSRDIS